jgi:3'-phosphoadenosine 5'-phosphosulfate (PAPS) 3'-phosphatase
MEWDTAAGHAIAIFAGAYLFSHPNRTQPFVYNKLNLTNGDFVVSVLQI